MLSVSATSFRQLVARRAHQKLRTFLTVFGIVWGTVAVSLMLAFGTGAAQADDQEQRPASATASSSPGRA